MASSYEGVYVDWVTDARFTATWHTGSRTTCRYPNVMYDGDTRQKGRDVMLCTDCMCFIGAKASFPVYWKEGLSPTVAAGLKRQTRAAACHQGDRDHDGRTFSTGVLIYNQYKVGMEASDWALPSVDKRQFIVATSNIVIVPPAIVSEFLWP
jgi:hypothetical protein